MRRKLAHSIASEFGLVFPLTDPVWCDAQELLITGGYRAGKSLRLAFKGLIKLLDPSVRLGWVVGPTYPQAQEEFRYIMEWGSRLGLVIPQSISTPKDGSRTLKTALGATLETRSGENAERLASVAPDFIIMCEPGQMSSEVYEACTARLIQKRGPLWMGGTLDDNVLKPRWQWYEDLAVDWLSHVEGDTERSFCLPTWSNTVDYPLGEEEPVLKAARLKVGEFKYQRMYGGQPQGVENPVFSILYEPGTHNEFMLEPEPDLQFSGGAIGVDYGRTWEHPSAVVALSEDQYGRYWIRDAWLGIKADPTDIVSIVESMKAQHHIWMGCVDPNQGYMGDSLNFTTAQGGSGSTEMRFSLTGGLLEERKLLFDINALNIREVWASMKSLRRVPRGGVMKYERPLGDDLAQAVNYAVEALRGVSILTTPPIDSGSVRFHSAATLSTPDSNEGRI